MMFLNPLIGALIRRLPRLSAIIGLAFAALFAYIGFFDPTATADDRLFFQVMTAVTLGLVAVFFFLFRRQRRDRLHPATDLSAWNPDLGPTEAMAPLSSDAQHTLLERSVNGNSINTVLLTNRDGLRIWHGSVNDTRDAIGFIRLGQLPTERAQPKLHVDWPQLRSIMHRGLSDKINVETLDENGQAKITTIDLAPNTAEVVDSLSRLGWEDTRVASPAALKRRDVAANLWLAVAAGVIVWGYGERWFEPPGDIVAGVAAAVVVAALIWLILGLRSTRRVLRPVFTR